MQTTIQTEFRRDFSNRKLESLCTLKRCSRDSAFGRFDTISACDRQTYGHRTTTNTASIASCGKSHTTELHLISVHVAYGPGSVLLAALQYVMYFRFCG